MSHGVPRAQTFSNIFQIIDNKTFNQCLTAHVKTLLPEIPKQVIAIDGKSLRGGGSKINELKASHAVSAWAADSGVTLGQEFVGANPHISSKKIRSGVEAFIAKGFSQKLTANGRDRMEPNYFLFCKQPKT